MRVRELPPLRLHVLATTPSGQTTRWAADERRPENTPSGISFSTVMPGGYESFSCDLPRQTQRVYSDLTRLSHLEVKGAGGRAAGEFRLEKAPRISSESDVGVSPQGVGYQAHLDDDPEAAEVYVDRDLSHWGGASAKRRADLYTAGVEVITDPSVDPDQSTGVPGLRLLFTGTGAALDYNCEGWYDAGPGSRVASIYYDYTSVATSAAYTGTIGTSDDADASNLSSSADLLTGSNSSGTGTQTGTAYRFGLASFRVTGGSPGESDHVMNFRRLTVWGNHGLTKRGTAPNDGLYASDVIADAISRWAPQLRFTTGADGTVKPTSFIVPQLEFRSPTVVSEMLKQANRFHLNDWAVWDDHTFYFNERNGRGRRWRARVRPQNLQETGPQVDRLWNGVIVTYQDVDGSSKTVGPTGALCDATSASLLDTDPLNPVNQLGIKRYAILDMGIVSTAAGATEVGRQFLVRSKDLDQSGSAEIVGHLSDDRGIVHPAWAVRAGDQISFVDASDTSYRRIVKTSYDHDSRTNSIDLDSPPEGMDALLERLSASLFTGNVGSTRSFSGSSKPASGRDDWRTQK